MSKPPITVGTIRGSKAVTDKSVALKAVPVEDRRVAIGIWLEENPNVIVEVLTNLAKIATNAKADSRRDAIAASKVLLDHTIGRPPEAKEAQPRQTLVIIRGADAEEALKELEAGEV